MNSTWHSSMHEYGIIDHSNATTCTHSSIQYYTRYNNIVPGTGTRIRTYQAQKATQHIQQRHSLMSARVTLH